MVEDNYTGVNSLVWGTIQVYGVSSSVSGVTVNGNPATYSYDIARQVYCIVTSHFKNLLCPLAKKINKFSYF